MARINENERLRTVELTPYDANWPDIFSEEAEKISQILQQNLSAIHHIGSTAIPGIYAKPVVDILPVVKDLSLVDALNPQFEALGYACLGEYGSPGRRFYWKSPEKRTHHVHLYAEGSPEINRHVAFRDFMLEHSDYAESYSMIKRCLADVFFHDIENYVNGKASYAKASFIAKALDNDKNWSCY